MKSSERWNESQTCLKGYSRKIFEESFVESYLLQTSASSVRCEQSLNWLEKQQPKKKKVLFLYAFRGLMVNTFK